MPIRSKLLAGDRTPDEHHGNLILDNKHVLRADLNNDRIYARTGSMIAYQGNAKFSRQGSGGIGNFLKKQMTGEGIDIMSVEGNAQVYFADDKANIQILEIDNDAISVNGRSVLAFTEGLRYNITRIAAPSAMLAGGLYNVELSGSGYVAVTTQGDPIALRVDNTPTYVDPQAVVLWTKNAQPSIKTDMGGIKSMLRGGSGEAIQLGFHGAGIVVVQPSEQPRLSDALNTSSNSSSGLNLGELFG